MSNSSAFFPSSNGDLSAIQMALGCKPLEGKECTNTYTERKPYQPGMPGEVVWNVEMDSAYEDVTAEHIAAGYHDDGVICEDFDALLEQIEDAGLRKQIKAKVPQVIAAFARSAFTNRRKIARWWRDAPEYVLVHKGKSSYLLDRRAKKLRKKWGL